MKKALFSLLMISVLGLSACAPSPGSISSPTQTAVLTVPTVTSPAPTATGAPACPSASEGTQLLTNEEYGYCLLYPDGYMRVDPLPYEVCLVPGETFLACHSANLMIEVEESVGLSAGQIADERIATEQAAIPGIEIARTDLTISAEPAVMLEGLPGVDSSRIILIVHADRLYRLMFVPWDQTGENFAQLQTLYDTVINSFTFLTQETGPRPIASPAAAEVQFRISAVSPVTIYSGPSPDFEQIGSLEPGATTGVLQMVEGESWPGHWMNIICPDGISGSCWVFGDANALYSYEGPPVDLEIPDPDSLNIDSSNKTTSPDGRWEVLVTQSETVTLGVEEARFFYVELRLTSLEDGGTWTPVSEWHAAGLGQEYAPETFHWSQNGRYLYYTSLYDHHGACVVYDNIGDYLDRADLIDHTIAVLQPPFPLGMLAISPDGTKMAYHSFTDGYYLVVRDMATAYDEGRRQESILWQVPLKLSQSADISQLAWAADNRHVLVTVTEMADICQPASVTKWDLDVETGEFVEVSSTVFPIVTP